MWTLDGKPVRTFKGHGGFVFTVSCLAGGKEIASAGDDCQVKIWDVATGECKQTIPIPRTIWSVIQNNHGDLLVGSEDYKVRSFTRDLSRMAEGDMMEEYQTELTTKTTA